MNACGRQEVKLSRSSQVGTTSDDARGRQSGGSRWAEGQFDPLDSVTRQTIARKSFRFLAELRDWPLT
jgi:hypothetical protein